MKLLLVDENKEELLYYSSIFERKGNDARPLSSYRDVATRIKHGPFDLLVMRQSVSNFSGRSVLARMAEKSQRPPVLALNHRIEPRGFSDQAWMQEPENLEDVLVPSEVAEQESAYLRLSSHAA